MLAQGEIVHGLHQYQDHILALKSAGHFIGHMVAADGEEMIDLFDGFG